MDSSASTMVFSFEGNYYDSTVFVLEVVEITFQTYQAYKLSALMPCIWINHVYAVVQILRCWSTVLVHEILPRSHLVKRVLHLAVDAAFDVITSVIIPTVIFLPYYFQFDFEVQDFALHNYYDDVWFIQSVSENRQIFVLSWIDFVSKLIPFVTTLGMVTVLKTCFVVCEATTLHRPVTQIPASSPPSKQHQGPEFSLRWKLVIQPNVLITGTTNINKKQGTSMVSVITTSHVPGRRQLITSTSRRKCSWRSASLFIVGICILIIHSRASVIGSSLHTRKCLLKMHPWLTMFPSCATFEVNCARGEHDQGADMESIEDILRHIKPDQLKVIVFSSCARLHVPHAIQTFSSLEMIKIYNSTIDIWDASAELHDNMHKQLLFLFISDSNLSNGEPSLV